MSSNSNATKLGENGIKNNEPSRKKSDFCQFLIIFALVYNYQLTEQT